MSRGKVGRNDPCPCGSGKKYKYCCLRKDQARQRRRGSAGRSLPGGARDAEGVLGQIGRLRRHLRRNVPEDQARELEKEADRLETMAAYAAKQDEITAAMETLEEHRPAFEKMMADPESAMKRALRLCSEERFDDVRISVADLRQAFEVVGYPTPGPEGWDERDMRIMVEAAIHLAGDDEDRFALSRWLMLAVPEYVAAGRYKDAWLLEYSAYRLVEEPRESNPFMFGMVELAFEAWGEQIREEQDALFAELDMDWSQFTGGSLQEALALAQNLAADSERVARLERFYEEHPDVRSMAAERVIELEREAAGLLEREDARAIIPSPSETIPWLKVLMERTGPLQDRARSQKVVRGEADANLARDAQETLGTVLREMVAAVYTPERVEQLVADLKAYRKKLRAAGEDQAARRVDSALMVTVGGVDPEESGFLFATCYASMRLALQAAAGAEREG